MKPKTAAYLQLFLGLMLLSITPPGVLVASIGKAAGAAVVCLAIWRIVSLGKMPPE